MALRGSSCLMPSQMTSMNFRSRSGEFRQASSVLQHQDIALLQDDVGMTSLHWVALKRNPDAVTALFASESSLTDTRNN
ncbi:hypothetical protein EJ03DRAFT_12496 [Teratosphaeria nubilosa]|uniref:Ankyrin n=1 Tax=Teratosphaeria nubilosa TaxID=161662 RepID=A0A6G1LHE4_9PEZI|nr:hypothetical protein EJ03DRAFT_12496 [Teratosphaeria nubilosa]